MKRIIVLLSLLLFTFSGMNSMAKTDESAPKLNLREIQGIVGQAGNWIKVTTKEDEAYLILDQARQGELRALLGKTVKIKGSWGISKQGKYLKDIESVEALVKEIKAQLEAIDSDF